MNFSLPIVQAVLLQSPLHLIWLAGIAMAWMHREEYPKVSWLVCIALTLLLVDATLGAYVKTWAPTILAQQDASTSARIVTDLFLSGASHLVVQVLAWSLLLFSMFSWRTSS